jgi:ABC-2 type transport system permease protein
MDKIFLKFVSFLSPVLLRMGVNTDQLQIILSIKLKMDNRRPSGLFAGRSNTKQMSDTSREWMTKVFTVIIGIFIGLILFASKGPYVAQSLYFVIFMVMLSLTLISDFTNVLIDVKDQYILLPRPVNDSTVAVSRILHISIYVLRVALLQGLPGVIMIGFIDGALAVPLFLLQILEATFLSILLVNIVYLVLMRIVSPQKFKDVISYFQIAFSVLIFATYYLLPKLINLSDLENVSLISHWWAYLLPPVWISALNELVFHGGRANTITAVLAGFGLVFPVIGLWFVAKVLAPGFNRSLSVLATSEGNNDSVVNKANASKFNFVNRISNFLIKDPVENAGFRITAKLGFRTREFKMKVYPGLAYVPIYFLYFALSGKADGNLSRWEKLQAGHNYVFLIYLCTFVLIAVLTNITMSDKYKSSWVYYVLPIGEPGKILSGMYKSIIVFYFLPYCLFIGGVTVSIWGFQAINDIILATLMCMVYGLIMALFMVKALPFSKPIEVKQGGGKIFLSLVVMAGIGAVAYAHYFSMKWELLIWALILPVLLIYWLMARYFKKQTWENIELAEI